MRYSQFVSGHSYQMGEFHIHPRILLISDGKPTYFSESINHDCSENGTLQVSSIYLTVYFFHRCFTM